MNPDELIEQLASNRSTLVALFESVSDERVRFRPDPKRWSMLEVLCHLRDEEREDFRARLQQLLRDPAETWTSIDPEAWPALRAYQEQDWRVVLGDFVTERQQSVKWLRELTTPNWDHTYEHPSLGAFRAGDLLASWVAHDFLHIRQISHASALYIGHVAKPYSIRYSAPALADS